MPQFAVHENKNHDTKKTYPYLLDIQTDLLSDLRTTVVIPLRPLINAGKQTLTRLCPILTIRGRKYVAFTQQLAGIDRRHLGKIVADLSAARSDIIAALDFLVTGF